jgi:predicted nuclease of predicted toxin-antitoxin system
MRVLLDECLPRRLKKELIGHEVQTVPEAGWAGKKNSELIRLALGRFEAFLTIDQNLPAQQILAGVPLGVIVLRAPSNRFADLQPLVPRILEALRSIQAGQVVHVGA